MRTIGGRWRFAVWAAFAAAVAACVGDSPDTTTSPTADGGTTDSGAADSAGGSDTGADTNDSGGLDAGGDADADAAVVACDPTKAFTDKRELTELNSGDNEISFSLTRDELFGVLGSTRTVDGGNSYHLFQTSRSAADASFGSLSEVFPGLSNVYSNGALDDVGLTLFIGTASPDAIIWDTRANVDASFVYQSSADLAAMDPQISADGKTLWVTSNEHDSAATMRILSYSWSSGTGVSNKRQYPNLALSSTSQEAAPVLSADQFTIYFASYPSDDNTYRIYAAHRTDRANDFDAPQKVTFLAEPGVGAEERPAWLSRDACRLYYVRIGNTGARDLWVATRTP